MEDATQQTPSDMNQWITYVNRTETSPMASRHILIESLDCVRTTQLAELLVHVMCTGARVVTEPNTEVLDF